MEKCNHKVVKITENGNIVKTIIYRCSKCRKVLNGDYQFKDRELEKRVQGFLNAFIKTM